VIVLALLKLKGEMLAPSFTRSADFQDVFCTVRASRNVCTQENLVDHFLNSSEQRAGPDLLVSAHYGKEGAPKLVFPEINQDTLWKQECGYNAGTRELF